MRRSSGDAGAPGWILHAAKTLFRCQSRYLRTGAWAPGGRINVSCRGGRRTGRRLARAPQRAWATPLQVLLIAERAALLSGRDDDFTMVVTTAYTGLRWGETIGLEREHTHPTEIHVEWQLRELRSAFHRLPPKDDSYRSPAWEPCLPVDLPPFLADLLNRQVQGQPRTRAPAPPSTAGPAVMYSSAPTAATTGAATTPAACSAPPATDGSNRPPAARLGWSSPMPRSGPASRLPCGHPPSPEQLHSSHREEEASRPSRTASRWPADFRSGPASPCTGSDTATRPGWPRTASQKSSPNSASATRSPACAASTPTPPTACAKTSGTRSRPAGTTPSANAPPSTPARRSRCSTNSSPNTAKHPAEPTQRHKESPGATPEPRETGRR